MPRTSSFAPSFGASTCENAIKSPTVAPHPGGGAERPELMS
jgi:hypothetical protein